MQAVARSFGPKECISCVSHSQWHSSASTHGQRCQWYRWKCCHLRQVIILINLVLLPSQRCKSTPSNCYRMECMPVYLRIFFDVISNIPTVLYTNSYAPLNVAIVYNFRYEDYWDSTIRRNSNRLVFSRLCCA